MGDWSLAIGVSLGVHVLALALLLLSFTSEPLPVANSAPAAEVMEAVAVDEAQVEEELRKLRRNERARRDAETERQRQLTEQAEKVRREREQEEQNLAEIKQKREQETLERQAQEEIERQRIADLKAEQERITIEKAALEKQREEEAKRVAELEKKRLAEEELKRKAEEDARKKAEAELKKKLAAEANAMAAQDRARKVDAAKAEYISLIANKVQRNWLRPPGTAGSVDCRVLVHQLPGGEVINVRLLESCGNPALDRSVEAAVRKASPLPAPPTPDVFDREIIFSFIAR